MRKAGKGALYIGFIQNMEMYPVCVCACITNVSGLGSRFAVNFYLTKVTRIYTRIYVMLFEITLFENVIFSSDIKIALSFPEFFYYVLIIKYLY